MNSNRSTAASTLYKKGPCAACGDWRFFRFHGHFGRSTSRLPGRVFFAAVI